MKRKKYTFLIIISLVLFILLAAGCNGAGDSNANSSGTNDSNSGPPAGVVDAGSGTIPGSQTPDPSVDWDILNDKAESFINHMVKNEYENAVNMFDNDMAQVLDSPSLSELWEAIEEHAGAFVSFHNIINLVVEEYFICDITSKHADTGVTLRIVFDKDHMIAGFFIMDYPVI